MWINEFVKGLRHIVFLLTGICGFLHCHSYRRWKSKYQCCYAHQRLKISGPIVEKEISSLVRQTGGNIFPRFFPPRWNHIPLLLMVLRAMKRIRSERIFCRRICAFFYALQASNTQYSGSMNKTLQTRIQNETAPYDMAYRGGSAPLERAGKICEESETTLAVPR